MVNRTDNFREHPQPLGGSRSKGLMKLNKKESEIQAWIWDFEFAFLGLGFRFLDVIAPECPVVSNVKSAVGDHWICPCLFHGAARVLGLIGRRKSAPFMITLGHSLDQ